MEKLAFFKIFTIVERIFKTAVTPFQVQPVSVMYLQNFKIIDQFFLAWSSSRI